MSLRSLRAFLPLAVATFTVIAAAIPVNASGEPAPASGTIQITSVVTNSVRQADGNTILDATLTGFTTGTFSGQFVEHLEEVVHPTGDSNIQGTATCACAVAGVGAGTIVFGFNATGEPGGALSGHYEIISATGGASGAHSQGTLSSPNGFVATYSGQVHS